MANSSFYLENTPFTEYNQAILDAEAVLAATLAAKASVEAIAATVAEGASVAADRATMAALPSATRIAVLTEDGRGGIFHQFVGTPPVADPLEILYVPSSTAGFYWSRQREGSEIHLVWAGIAVGPLSASAGLVAADFDATVELQAVLNLAGALGGGCVRNPFGKIAVSAPVTIPDNVQWGSSDRNLSHVIITNTIGANLDVFTNETRSITTGELGAPGIRIFGLTFDGELREFPAWLSTSEGVAITDWEADYRVGGALAPTTIPTATAVISGGAITSVTPGGAGSGVTHPPAVWVTGDGIGARITANIAAGAVTGYTVVDGGRDYTTATLEIAGGGADPTTALYAANRRNPGYASSGGIFNFRKAINPIIEDCAFLRYGAMVILDSGCDRMVVRRNYFKECGQGDCAAHVLWAQSDGSISAPPAYFRQSTGTRFYENDCVDLARGVALLNGIRQRAYSNNINGWGESAFFIANNADDYLIDGNFAKGGLLTDIACAFVEGAKSTRVRNNIVEDVDGSFVSTTGDGLDCSGNSFRAGASFTEKYPAGPFSERVGFGVGSAALAGTYRDFNTIRSMVQIADVSGLDEPKAARVSNLTIIDAAGLYDNVVTFSRGSANLIGDVLINGVDITQAPSIGLFNAAQADLCLNKNKKLRCIDNPGHVSMGAVQQYVTIPAASSGTYKFTFGFRPRKITIYARDPAAATEIAHYWAIYVDEFIKNPGTAGGTNLSGSLLRAGVNTGATAAVAAMQNQGGFQVANSAGSVILNGASIGFSSDGWTINITSSTADVILAITAEP